MTAACLGRIAANVLETGAIGRRAVDLAGWRAFLGPSAEDDATSFAVPATAAARDPASLDALFALFREERRPLRVELVDELHPGLCAALVARGLSVRAHDGLMTLDAATLGAPPPLAADVRVERVGEADVDTMLALQDASYATPLTAAGRAAWGAVMGAGIASGRVLALIAHRGGRPVATAALLTGAGAGELSGVATLPGERRRGLARGLCARLLAEGFATAIDLAWLSAAGGPAAALYTRLGFVPVGTQVSLAKE